jgi:hypothetical protein
MSYESRDPPGSPPAGLIGSPHEDRIEDRENAGQEEGRRDEELPFSRLLPRQILLQRIRAASLSPFARCLVVADPFLIRGAGHRGRSNLLPPQDPLGRNQDQIETNAACEWRSMPTLTCDPCSTPTPYLSRAASIGHLWSSSRNWCKSFQRMPGSTRLGGVTTRRTLVVGYSDELPDLVLKYEVIDRDGDRYVLAQPGHADRSFTGHVGQFELLGTRIFRERVRFAEDLRTGRASSHATWESERERLMAEWDAFPGVSWS